MTSQNKTFEDDIAGVEAPGYHVTLSYLTDLDENCDKSHFFMCH